MYESESEKENTDTHARDFAVSQENITLTEAPPESSGVRKKKSE